jgi:hypothetical protein
LLILLAGFPLFAGDSWTVGYYAGTFRHQRGANLQLRLEPDALLLRESDGGTRAIPLSALSEVSYERVRFQRFDHLMDTDEVSALSFDDPRLIIPELALVVAVAILNPLVEIPHGQKHLIHLLWTEDGKQRGLILEVPKRDAYGLVAALQQATGRAPRDVNAMRDEILGDVARAQRFPITLKLDGRVGNPDLVPGAYEVAYVDRRDGQGDLVWSRREGRRMHPVAVTLASRSPLPISGGPVEYVQEPGGWAVSGVRLGDQSYSLRPDGACTLSYRWKEGGSLELEWRVEARHCADPRAELEHLAPLRAHPYQPSVASAGFDPAARERAIKALQESLRRTPPVPEHLKPW